MAAVSAVSDKSGVKVAKQKDVSLFEIDVEEAQKRFGIQLPNKVLLLGMPHGITIENESSVRKLLEVIVRLENAFLVVQDTKRAYDAQLTKIEAESVAEDKKNAGEAIEKAKTAWISALMAFGEVKDSHFSVMVEHGICDSRTWIVDE